MANVNYLSETEDPYQQIPGVGVLSGALFNEKLENYRNRYNLQNQLMNLQNQQTEEQLRDYRLAGPSRQAGYDFTTMDLGYKKDLLPGQFAYDKDVQTGKLARLPKEEELKWAQAARLLSDDELQRYLKEIDIMKAFAPGIIGDKGELQEDMVIPFLNVLPKGIDTSRWRKAFEETPGDLAFMGTAGAQEGPITQTLDPTTQQPQEITVPPVTIPGMDRSRALRELRAILNMNPEVLKQRYSRETQDVTESGLETRNIRDNLTRLLSAREAADAAGAAVKQKDEVLRLARQARAKSIQIDRRNDLTPEQKEEAKRNFITPEEQAAYEMQEALSFAARAAAQTSGRLAETGELIPGLGIQPGNVQIPSSLPPLYQGTEPRPNQQNLPKEITSKGRRYKVLGQNPDGSYIVQDENGTRGTLRPVQ